MSWSRARISVLAVSRWGHARWPCEHDYRDRDPRLGRIRGLRGDLEGAEHAAHAADVGHERDPRHRRAGWPVADARGPWSARAFPAGGRDRVRDDQHRRRVRGHRPDARYVQEEARAAFGTGRRREGDRAAVSVATIFLQSSNFI